MTGLTLVFRNGGVFDGRVHRSGRAVVVADGRVRAVVPQEEATSYVRAGERAVEVDLAGGLLLPGFQDAHVHPVQGGIERMRCDLSELATREEYTEAIASYASSHPDLPWLVGGGWAMSVFGTSGPTADALSAVVPDRPVLLPNRDHHGAWVNHRALELAGLHAGTPDPPDGRLERDGSGGPTGTLHEGAMALVARHLPETSADEYDQGLLVAQAYLHSFGRHGVAGRDPRRLRRRRRRVPGVPPGRRVRTSSPRGCGAPSGGSATEGSNRSTELVERRATYTRGRLVAGSVKVMQDGVVENYTAAMSMPYLDALRPLDGQPRPVVRRPGCAARGT